MRSLCLIGLPEPGACGRFDSPLCSTTGRFFHQGKAVSVRSDGRVVKNLDPRPRSAMTRYSELRIRSQVPSSRGEESRAIVVCGPRDAISRNPVLNRTHRCPVCRIFDIALFDIVRYSSAHQYYSRPTDDRNFDARRSAPQELELHKRRKGSSSSRHSSFSHCAQSQERDRKSHTTPGLPTCEDCACCILS